MRRVHLLPAKKGTHTCFGEKKEIRRDFGGAEEKIREEKVRR